MQCSTNPERNIGKISLLRPRASCSPNNNTDVSQHTKGSLQHLAAPTSDISHRETPCDTDSVILPYSPSTLGCVYSNSLLIAVKLPEVINNNNHRNGTHHCHPTVSNINNNLWSLGSHSEPHTKISDGCENSTGLKVHYLNVLQNEQGHNESAWNPFYLKQCEEPSSKEWTPSYMCVAAVNRNENKRNSPPQEESETKNKCDGTISDHGEKKLSHTVCSLLYTRSRNWTKTDDNHMVVCMPPVTCLLNNSPTLAYCDGNNIEGDKNGNLQENEKEEETVIVTLWAMKLGTSITTGVANVVQDDDCMCSEHSQTIRTIEWKKVYLRCTTAKKAMNYSKIELKSNKNKINDKNSSPVDEERYTHVNNYDSCSDGIVHHTNDEEDMREIILLRKLIDGCGDGTVRWEAVMPPCDPYGTNIQLFLVVCSAMCIDEKKGDDSGDVITDTRHASQTTKVTDETSMKMKSSDGIYMVSLDFNSMSIFIVGKCENPNEAYEKYKEGNPTVISVGDNAAIRRHQEAVAAWNKVLDLERCSVWIANGTSTAVTIPTTNIPVSPGDEKQRRLDSPTEYSSHTLITKYNNTAKMCADSSLALDRYGNTISPISRTSLHSNQIRIQILQKTREEEAETNRLLLRNNREQQTHNVGSRHLRGHKGIYDRTEEAFQDAGQKLDSRNTSTILISDGIISSDSEDDKYTSDIPEQQQEEDQNSTTVSKLAASKNDNNRTGSLPLTIVIAGGHSKSTGLANSSVLLLTSDITLTRLHVFGNGLTVGPVDVFRLFASGNKNNYHANGFGHDVDKNLSFLSREFASTEHIVKTSHEYSCILLNHYEHWKRKGEETVDSQRQMKATIDRVRMKSLEKFEGDENIIKIFKNLSTADLRDLTENDINESDIYGSSSSYYSTTFDDDPKENIFDIKSFLLNAIKKAERDDRCVTFVRNNEKRHETPSYASPLRRFIKTEEENENKTSSKSELGKRKNLMNLGDDGAAIGPLQTLALVVICNAPPSSKTGDVPYLYKYDKGKSSLLWMGSESTYQLNISKEPHPLWSKLPLFRSKIKYASAHIPQCAKVSNNRLPLGIYGMDEKLYLIVHVLDDSCCRNRLINTLDTDTGQTQVSTLYIVDSGDAPAKTRPVIWGAKEQSRTPCKPLLSKSPQDMHKMPFPPPTLPEIDGNLNRHLRKGVGRRVRSDARYSPRRSQEKAEKQNLPSILDVEPSWPKTAGTLSNQIGTKKDITVTRRLLTGRQFIAEISPRCYTTQSQGATVKKKKTTISSNPSTYSVMNVLQLVVSGSSTTADFSDCPVPISCGDIFYIIHTIQHNRGVDTLNISNHTFGQVETKLVIEDLIGTCTHIKSVIMDGTKFFPHNKSADIKKCINNLMKSRDALYSEENRCAMEKQKERKFQRNCVKIMKKEFREGICVKQRSKAETAAMQYIRKTFFCEALAFLAMFAEYRLNSLFLKEYYQREHSYSVIKLEITCHHSLSELFSDEVVEYNKLQLLSRTRMVELISRLRKQEEVRVRRQLAQERRDQNKLDHKIREMERACLHVIDAEEKSARNEIIGQKEQKYDVMLQCYRLLMRLYHLRASNERTFNDFRNLGDQTFKQCCDSANRTFSIGQRNAIHKYEQSIHDQGRKYERELEELKVMKQNAFDYATRDVVRWLRSERLKSRLALRMEPPKLFLESLINEVMVTEDSMYAQQIPIAMGITVTPVIPFYMKNKHNVIFEEDEIKPETWIQLKSSIHKVKVVVTVKEITTSGKPFDHATESTFTLMKINNPRSPSDGKDYSSPWPIIIRAFADKHPYEFNSGITAIKEAVEEEWDAYLESIENLQEVSSGKEYNNDSDSSPEITLTPASETPTSHRSSSGKNKQSKTTAVKKSCGVLAIGSFDVQDRPPPSYNPSHHIPVFSCSMDAHLKVQGQPSSEEGAIIVNTRTGAELGKYRVTPFEEHIVELIGNCTEENIHSILHSFSVLPAPGDESSSKVCVPQTERTHHHSPFQERLFQLNASIEVMLRVPPELVDIAHLSINETDHSLSDSYESSLRPSPRIYTPPKFPSAILDTTKSGRSVVETEVPQVPKYILAEIGHTITIRVIPPIIALPSMVVADKDKDGNFFAKKVDSNGFCNPKEMMYTEMSGPQPYWKHAFFNANNNPHIIPYLPKAIITVQMHPKLDPFDCFQFGNGFTVEERPVWHSPESAAYIPVGSHGVANGELPLRSSVLGTYASNSKNPMAYPLSQEADSLLDYSDLHTTRMPTKLVLTYKGVPLATLLDPGPLRYDVSNSAHNSRHKGRRSFVSKSNSSVAFINYPSTLVAEVIAVGSGSGGTIPAKNSTTVENTDSKSTKKKDQTKEEIAMIRKAEAMRKAIIAQNNARRKEIILFQMQMQQHQQLGSSVLKLQLNERATPDTLVQIVRGLQFTNTSLMSVQGPRQMVIGVSLFTPVSLSSGTLTNWSPSIPAFHCNAGTGAIAMALASVPGTAEKIKALNVHSFTAVTIEIEDKETPTIIDLVLDVVGHHLPHSIPAAHRVFVPEYGGEDCYFGSVCLVYNTNVTTFTGGYLNIAVCEGYNKDKEYIDFKPKTEGVYDNTYLDLNALNSHVSTTNDLAKERLSLEGNQVFYGGKLVAILDRRAGEKNKYDYDRNTGFSRNKRSYSRLLMGRRQSSKKRLQKFGTPKCKDSFEQSPYMVGSTLPLDSIPEGGKLTFYFIKRDERFNDIPVDLDCSEKEIPGNTRQQTSKGAGDLSVSGEPSCLIIPPGYVPTECSMEIVQEIIRNVTFSSGERNPSYDSGNSSMMNSNITKNVTDKRSIVFEFTHGSFKPVYGRITVKQSGPLICISSKATYITHPEDGGPCPILNDITVHNDGDGWDGGFAVLECVRGFNRLTDTLSLISKEKGIGKGITLIEKEKLGYKANSLKDLKSNRFKTTVTMITSAIRAGKNSTNQQHANLANSKEQKHNQRQSTLIDLKTSMLQQATKPHQIINLETDSYVMTLDRSTREKISDVISESDSIYSQSLNSQRLLSFISYTVAYDLYYAKLDKVIGTVEVKANMLTIHFHRFTSDGTPISDTTLPIDDSQFPGHKALLHDDDITTILRLLTYESTDHDPQDLTRIFKITVNDGRPHNSSATCQLELLTNDVVTDITRICSDPNEPVQYRALTERDNEGFCFLDDVSVTDPDTFSFNGSVLSVECIGGHDVTDTISILSEEQQLAHKRQLIFKRRQADYQQLMLKYQHAELIRAAAQTAASLNVSTKQKLRRKRNELMLRESIAIDTSIALTSECSPSPDGHTNEHDSFGSLGNDFLNLLSNPPRQDDPENDFDVEAFRSNELVTVCDVPSLHSDTAIKGSSSPVSVVCVGQRPIGIIQFKKGAPTYTITVGVSANMKEVNTHAEAEEAFDNWEHKSTDMSTITSEASIDFPCVPISVVQRIFHVTSFKSVHQCPNRIRGGNRIFEIKVGIGKVIGKLRMTVNVQPPLITQLFAPQIPQITFKNGGEPCKLFPNITFSAQEQSSAVKKGFITVGLVIPNNKYRSCSRLDTLGCSQISRKSTETKLFKNEKIIDDENMDGSSELGVFVENTDQVTVLIPGMMSLLSDRLSSNQRDRIQKDEKQLGGSRNQITDKMKGISTTANENPSTVEDENTPASIDSLLYGTVRGSDSRLGTSGAVKSMNTNWTNYKHQKKSLVDPSQFIIVEGSQLYYKKDFIGVVTSDYTEQYTRTGLTNSQCETFVHSVESSIVGERSTATNSVVSKDLPLIKSDKVLFVDNDESIAGKKESENIVPDVTPCITSITVSFNAASKATVAHVEAFCRLCAYQSVAPNPSVRRRTAFVDVRLGEGLDGKGCVPLQVITDDNPTEIIPAARAVMCTVDGGPVQLLAEATVEGIDDVLMEPSFMRLEVLEVGNRQGMLSVDLMQSGVTAASTYTEERTSMKRCLDNPALAGEWLYLYPFNDTQCDARIMPTVSDVVIGEKEKAKAFTDEENRFALYVYNDMIDDSNGELFSGNLGINQFKLDTHKKELDVITNSPTYAKDDSRRLLCKVIRLSPNCLVFKMVNCRIDELQTLANMIMYNAFTPPPCPVPGKISEYNLSNSVCPVANTQRSLRITFKVGAAPSFCTAVNIHVTPPMLTLFPPFPLSERQDQVVYPFGSLETILEMWHGPPVPVFPYLNINYRNFSRGALFVVSLQKPPESQTGANFFDNLPNGFPPMLYNSLNIDMGAVDRANKSALDASDHKRTLLIKPGYEVELKPTPTGKKKSITVPETHSIATASPICMIVVSRSLVGHLCDVSSQCLAGVIYGTESSRVSNEENTPVLAMGRRSSTSSSDIRSNRDSIERRATTADSQQLPPIKYSQDSIGKISSKLSASNTPIEGNSDKPLFPLCAHRVKVLPLAHTSTAETVEEEEAMIAAANAPGAGATLQRVLQRIHFTTSDEDANGSINNGSIVPVYLTVVDIGSGIASTYTSGVQLMES